MNWQNYYSYLYIFGIDDWKLFLFDYGEGLRLVLDWKEKVSLRLFDIPFFFPRWSLISRDYCCCLMILSILFWMVSAFFMVCPICDCTSDVFKKCITLWLSFYLLLDENLELIIIPKSSSLFFFLSLNSVRILFILAWKYADTFSSFWLK
jgi:hypothetical protein